MATLSKRLLFQCAGGGETGDHLSGHFSFARSAVLVCGCAHFMAFP